MSTPGAMIKPYLRVEGTVLPGACLHAQGHCQVQAPWARAWDGSSSPPGVGWWWPPHLHGPLPPCHLMEMVMVYRPAKEHHPLSSLFCLQNPSDTNQPLLLSPCPPPSSAPQCLHSVACRVLQMAPSLLSPSPATEKFKALRQLIWELPEIDPLHNNYTEKNPLPFPTFNPTLILVIRN